MSTLRELRNQRGLTQAQVAEHMGVSNVTLGKWENGKSVPADETLARLAEFYEVAPGDITFLRNEHRAKGDYSSQSPYDQTDQATSQVVNLEQGTITVTSTVNLFNLSREERRLVMALLDALDELKAVVHS